MPKLRISATDLKNRAVIANIKYGMAMAGVEPTGLALAMRTSLKTVYSRFKRPGDFRLRELQAVSEKLHIPLEQLITGKTALR